MTVRVPDQLIGYLRKWHGEAAQPWIDAAPHLVDQLLGQWRLRLDGSPTNGMWGLIVPVVREAGMRAVMKLQPLIGTTLDIAGEAVALRIWDGDGAVRLLEWDPTSGSMLLERLDPTRSLMSVADDSEAFRIISELLSRLTKPPAPAGLRRVADLAASWLERTEVALARSLPDWRRSLLVNCASVLREVLPEPGDRLLHADLHFDNVLASEGDLPREPWLAIDPNPLIGDPGFAMLAALHNRWDQAVATGDLQNTLRRRFELMTEILGLDRQRARAWILGCILQNVLWDVEHNDTVWHTEPDKVIAFTLLGLRP